MKYFLLFILIILTTCYSAETVAQDSTNYEYEEDEESEGYSYSQINPREVSKKNGYESKQVDVRKFDDKLWNEVIKGTDYSETETADKKSKAQRDSIARANLDERMRRNRNADSGETESYSSDSETKGSPVFTIIVYALAIAIIGYLIYFIIRNMPARSREKSSLNKDKINSPAFVEDIKELEIDRLLSDALKSSNYRLAVRIYFLGLLQKLDEDGLIAWKKDKTNRDYLSELYLKTHHFEDIKSLTIAYEEVWYGDHDLSIPTYEKIISLFNGLIEKLKASKAE